MGNHVLHGISLIPFPVLEMGVFEWAFVATKYLSFEAFFLVRKCMPETPKQ